MDAIPAFAGTNIAQKTDAGIYTTPPSGPNSVLPHAVSSITVCSGCTVDGIPGGDVINFYYDGNGNLNCETTASQCDTSAINKLSWTSFNRPSSIVHEGATTLGYSGACPPARLGRDRRNPEHPPSPRLRRTGNRIEMNAPGSLTKYLSDPASGVMTQHMGPTVTPYVDRDYIMADGHMVAIIVTQNSSTTSIYYPILDHLGSVAVIVDGNVTLPNGNANPNYGTAIDRYSYDAWGEARDPGQWTPRTCSDGPQPPFVRGFTGQEQLPAGVCLTNFNARIYNPAIGRFFSADPTVEAPYNPQDLNRYSYVLNDPTVFTDPSGLCFLGCFWQSPIFRDVLAIAVAVVFQQYESVIFEGLGESADFVTSAAGMVVNAGIIGGVAGAISTGTLKGAALGALQAGMFAEAGNLLEGPDGFTIFGSHDASSLVAHGLVGGLVSVAGGHNFESGFLAGGVSSLADLGDFQTSNFEANVVEHAVLGGAGSLLGGGKFENGAITGAFGYLFNACMHGQCDGGLNGYGYVSQSGDNALLARIMFSESAADPDAYPDIGWAVVNWVDADGFPDSLQGVIYQQDGSGNYELGVGTPLWNESGDPSLLTGANAASYASALGIANGILNGSVGDPTDGSQYFYSGPEPAHGFFPQAISSGRLAPMVTAGPFSFFKDMQSQ